MSLTTADVACIQILLDFISTGSKLHGGPIMAFVHILVDVLDGLNGGNGLHIDVTAISPDEVLGVADNPLVGDLLASNFMCLASVGAPCMCIRVISHRGVFPKWLWETLGTFAIDHTGGIRILLSAGHMNHVLLNKFKKFRVVFRKFRGHKTVNVFWRAQLGMRLKEDNDVGMRKTMLLKLNSIEEGSHISQYTSFDIRYERIKLEVENANHQVRAIRGRLASKKGLLNLRPGRIGCHSDKEVPSSKEAIDGQGILTVLLHIACAPRKS